MVLLHVLQQRIPARSVGLEYIHPNGRDRHHTSVSECARAHTRVAHHFNVADLDAQCGAGAVRARGEAEKTRGMGGVRGLVKGFELGWRQRGVYIPGCRKGVDKGIWPSALAELFVRG